MKTYEELVEENLKLKKLLKDKSNLIERKYKSLIENAIDAVTVIDSNIRYKYASPSIKQLGYTIEEFLELNPNEVTHPEDIPLLIETIQKIIQNPSKSLTVEYRFRAANNNWIWLESTFKNMFSDTNINGIVINSRGIHDRKIAEEKLKENEEKYRFLIENISDVIWVYDVELEKMVFISQSIEKLVGYTVEESMNQSINDMFTQDSCVEIKEHIRSRIDLFLKNKTKIIYTDEYKQLCKNKSFVWVEVNAYVRINPKNDKLEIIGVTRNINEKKLYEYKIKQNEEKFLNLFQYSPDMIILTRLSDGKILDVNDRFLSHTKHKRYSVIGKSTLDINLWFDKSDRDNFIDLLSKDGFVRNKEYDLKIKSNEKINCLISSIVTIINKEKCILSTIRDITEQKKIQNKLNDERIRLKTIFESTPDFIFIKDLNGKYLACNKRIEELFGAKEKDIIGKTDFDFLPKEVAEEFVSNDKRAIKENKSVNMIEHLVYPDGHKEIGQATKTPIYDHTNKLIGILGVAHNITEIYKYQQEIKRLNQNLEEKVKERTEQLEQVNKDLESFTYSVSHDLRAPIRHIDGFSKLLKNSIKNISDESERYLNKITQSSNKMSNMIDDLLKFSRLGRKSLEKTNVDLNVLVKEIIEQYKIDIGNRKVEFIIGELPNIKGDKTLLQVVFENLISNAIKFTSKKEIAIIEINQCKKTDSKSTIYIKDNGAGFDMAYYDKLFGVFQRLHMESEFSGTGIGLANIKQIIQKHGGKIYAEGEVNKGATFYLSL